MTDQLLTWISGSAAFDSPELAVFLKSAAKHLPAVEKMFFTTDQTPIPKIVEIGDKYKFNCVRGCSPHSCITRDRWFHYYQRLVRTAWSHRYVMLCDSRDILFQSNPFDLVAETRSDGRPFLMVFQEGMLHHESHWNMGDQLSFQSECGEYGIADCKNWPVVNGGVVIGTPREVANFCLLMWMTTLKTKSGATDQATMNYLIHGPLKGDGIHESVSPHTSPLVLTGEGVKFGHVNARMIDGLVWNIKLVEPCSLYHQWDRTVHRQAILDAWGDK